MESVDGEMKTKNGSLKTILVLDDRIVEQLVGLGQLAIDEPGQVRSRVSTV